MPPSLMIDMTYHSLNWQIAAVYLLLHDWVKFLNLISCLNEKTQYANSSLTKTFKSVRVH